MIDLKVYRHTYCVSVYTFLYHKNKYSNDIFFQFRKFYIFCYISFLYYFRFNAKRKTILNIKLEIFVVSLYFIGYILYDNARSSNLPTINYICIGYQVHEYSRWIIVFVKGTIRSSVVHFRFIFFLF